jgi:hypothetical protein
LWQGLGVKVSGTLAPLFFLFLNKRGAIPMLKRLPATNFVFRGDLKGLLATLLLVKQKDVTMKACVCRGP